jgi:hypothetical protein
MLMAAVLLILLCLLHWQYSWQLVVSDAKKIKVGTHKVLANGSC